MKYKHKLLTLLVFIVSFFLSNNQYMYASVSTESILVAQVPNIFSESPSYQTWEVINQPKLRVQAFSNNYNTVQSPSMGLESKLGIGLRAGPDLGGDIEDEGGSGIGRELSIPSSSWITFVILFILYFTIWLIKKRTHYCILKTKTLTIMKRFVLPLFLITFFISTAKAQTNPNPVTDILYVKTSQQGIGDGSDWDNAFDGQYLAWFLKNKAQNNTVVYIAEGTYLPFVPVFDDNATARFYSFELRYSIEIHGGYSNASVGTDLSSYDPQNNITRLSGDIGVANDSTDNSYNVVKITALTGTLVDGFYISDGNGSYHNGGGIMAPNNALLTLLNSVVEKNSCFSGYNPVEDKETGGYGGGINSNLATISNCLIRNNYSQFNGGGLYNSNTLTLENTTIINNNSGGTGAGLLPGSSFTLIGDIVIEKNTSNSHGGAMYVANTTFNTDLLTSLKIIDCVSSGNGGGIVFNGAANLVLDGSTADITISGNKGSRGGAISMNSLSSLTFRNLSMSNNTATVSGGAINAAGGTSSALGSITMENVTFNNNIAPAGAAIFSNAIVTDISKCTFIENAAGGSGGAIYFSQRANGNIKNNTFSQNKANGLNISSSSNNPGGGGAIKIPHLATVTDPGIVSIISNTFNGNVATNSTGHAIDLGFPQGNTVNGNIIYGNGTDGTEISLDPEEAIYNIERGTTLQSSTNLHIESGKADSIFTDIDSGDLAILANNGSDTKVYNIVRNGFAYNLVPPAIANTWGLPATDQKNQQRLFSCKLDAGSVELQEVEDVMTYQVGTLIICPDSLFNANDLITSRVNVKKIDYFSDPTFTTPITMPISISQAGNVYGRVVSTSNCDEDETLFIDVFAHESTWENNGNDSDWNNSANWSDGIPGPCTDVIIPSGKTHYPILAANTAATCDTIGFKFGGEVAKTNYLEYNSAKVDLTLDANRWYMLSPVLQQQYSGDYLEDAAMYRLNPEISIMYYQTGNPQTGSGKVSSKFTGIFNTVDELLKITSGHALWVDNGNRPESEFTIHFPKDSTQYAYYNDVNEVVRFSGTMDRDKSGRFIYEGNASYQSNGDGTFSQNIENSNQYPQLIIGNPYMSHLDIVEFQLQNDTYLEKSFRIWKNGTSYETYLIDGSGNVISTDGMGEDGYQIPPMQSFIINTKQAFTAPILFTPDMSITQPGKTLRNAAEKVSASNIINVEVLREGVRQSALALQYKLGESSHYNKNKDVWTIIPENVGSYVSIHSLVDAGATSIHTTGDIVTPIDLSVAVGNTVKNSIKKLGKETFTIQIAGNKYLAGADVFLVDKETNKTHNLSQSAYVFDNKTGDVNNRFQLFTTGALSIDENGYDNDLQIFYQNGAIKAISSTDNPIKSISIYSILGEELYTGTELNTFNFSLNIKKENKVIVVKVQTEKNNKTQKIILK